MNKYKFFWEGPFSNWYPSNFMYNGNGFNCAEQAIMCAKAIYFNDFNTAELIMESISPKDQTALGRKVKNFDAKQWNQIKYEKVKEILRCKFTQNPHLLDLLVRNKGLEFVEASPDNRILENGYEESTTLDNIDKWGENLLGKILTELSNEYDSNRKHKGSNP
jgi:ribA/ribD-fused uncharacterized protein